MNTDSGRLKKWEELTQTEIESGKWVPAPNGAELRDGIPYLHGRPVSKSDLKRELYMRRVREKRAEGENV
jgi:hypothetical protein